MNYFPPPDAKAEWSYGDKRLSLYKNWYMAVSSNFKAHIWKHTIIDYKQKIIKKTKKFRDERAAVLWCENQVEMELIKESLVFQERGSGI